MLARKKLVAALVAVSVVASVLLGLPSVSSAGGFLGCNPLVWNSGTSLPASNLQGSIDITNLAGSQQQLEVHPTSGNFIFQLIRTDANGDDIHQNFDPNIPGDASEVRQGPITHVEADICNVASSGGSTTTTSNTTTSNMPPDPDVPEGCFVTSHVYEGDQFGDTFAVAVDFVGTPQPPYDIRVVVSAQPGYWLQRVKGGWLGPSGVEGIDWTNPDGIANRSYSLDAYGAGIGIRGIACQYPCMASPPTLPGTPGGSLPEPPCHVPPTLLPQLPLICPEGSVVVVDGPGGPYCQATLAAQAVLATPIFTG